MTVTPVPFEPTRFWVSSESRPIDHLVDMNWREEKWMRPKAVCSCEQVQAKGLSTCKHIFRVVDYLNRKPQ